MLEENRGEATDRKTNEKKHETRKGEKKKTRRLFKCTTEINF
jgi:hypothetical protein